MAKPAASFTFPKLFNLSLLDCHFDSVTASVDSSYEITNMAIVHLYSVQALPNPIFADLGVIGEKPTMKGGRKNLKRAVSGKSLALEDGQSVMQVLSLRGSNLIEVMDRQGEKSLAMFPAKFQKSIWIKRGSFVVVDESGKEKALKDGSKVASIVSQVLFYEQVQALQKSSEWPEIFKSKNLEDSNGSMERHVSHHEVNNHSAKSDDDDDGLPPLEANTNRVKPFEMQPGCESDSGSETES